MVRLQTGIALCLLYLLGFTSPTHAQETNLGNVSLKDNRLLFQSPATPNQYGGFVTVACPSKEGDAATPTKKPIQPLLTARTGETLTILEFMRCEYTNGDDFDGAFIKVRTSTGTAGYTQLPNYHNRIQPTNEDGAFHALFLNRTDCDLDPDCHVKFASPFIEFINKNTPSRNTARAASEASKHLHAAAASYGILATDPQFFPNLASRYTQYDRKTLKAKADQSSALARDLQDYWYKNYYPEWQRTLFEVLLIITNFYFLTLFVCIGYIVLYSAIYKRITGGQPPRLSPLLVEAAIGFILAHFFYYIIYSVFRESAIQSSGSSACFLATCFIVRAVFSLKAVEKDEDTRRKLVSDAVSSSDDDIDLHLHQLNRYRSRQQPSKQNQKKVDELDDTILNLKRREERKRRNDTPPDTIIGYSHE